MPDCLAQALRDRHALDLRRDARLRLGQLEQRHAPRLEWPHDTYTIEQVLLAPSDDSGPVTGRVLPMTTVPPEEPPESDESSPQAATPTRTTSDTTADVMCVGFTDPFLSL